jgi:hypothetical protein
VQSNLEREVRFLRFYVSVLTCCCLLVAAAAFSPRYARQKLAEIDVERINIVEKDGRLRMVISNEARQHPGIVNGKLIVRQGTRPPGIIFFNQLGDEMGGIVFGENGGNGHFGSLTFDKVRNDQTIGFRHLEGDNGQYQTGLEMWQQPNVPSDVLQAKYDAARRIVDEKARAAALQAMVDNNEVTTQRLFLGKQRDNALVLEMADIKGRPRIAMQVAPDGTPRLDFLSETGAIIYSLPTSTNESPEKN